MIERGFLLVPLLALCALSCRDADPVNRGYEAGGAALDGRAAGSNVVDAAVEDAAAADATAAPDATPPVFLGTWVSEGENLEALADVVAQQTGIRFVKVTLTISARSYAIDSVDDGGLLLSTSGSIQLTPSSNGTIHLLRMEQEVPMRTVAEGIAQVDEDSTPALLRLETVQTEPRIAGVPVIVPVASLGFGFALTPTQMFERR